MEDGATGFLFASTDAGVLTEALAKLMTDKKLAAHRLGRNARQHNVLTSLDGRSESAEIKSLDVRDSAA